MVHCMRCSFKKLGGDMQAHSAICDDAHDILVEFEDWLSA